MSTQLQLRRDTAANIAASTPAAGEPWYDTTNKRLNIGDGSNVGGIEIPNYIDIQNGSFDYALDTGAENALVITTAPSNPTAYVAGQRVRVKIANTNTATTTINWGGLGVKTIRKWSNGSLIDLSGAELTVGMIVTLDYDGTYFVLLSGSGGGIIISRQVFTSSGTWTKPSGLLYADVEVLGGGGGGGGTSGSTAPSAGGTTSFGAHCSATGGAAGGSNHTPSTNAYPSGGGGGGGSGGDIVANGQAGERPDIYPTGSRGGMGGSSYLGGEGSYGAGGSGGSQGISGSSAAGGGGGGYAKKLIIAASLGSTETVTVGGGGSNGSGGSFRGNGGSQGVVIVTEYRSA